VLATHTVRAAGVAVSTGDGAATGEGAGDGEDADDADGVFDVADGVDAAGDGETAATTAAVGAAALEPGFVQAASASELTSSQTIRIRNIAIRMNRQWP
jgi:hypothetical protein